MPNQASTPRTTRNSRGLRRSPSASSVDSCLGKSARVSRRRRTSGTPARASLVNALASSTHASPATPTPAAPSAQPIPDSPQTPALGTIPEEQPQPQPGTPTPAVVDAVARPPVIPPPVTLPPPTPYLSTPPPRTSPPLEHPRTSSTQSTSPTSARRQVPRRIPVIRTNRYRTVYVDVTPTKPESPAPESLGDETRRFRQRRDEEGDDKFTRELWIAIRNDQYMKGCWCGHPNIYNSKEEAEVAAGHLRFYVAGSETKNLRVLQKKDDHRWHCMCGNAEYHPVYKELINANGKRPAEESEVDLIAQNQGSPDRQGVERVLPPLPEPASDNEDQPQSPELPHSAPAQSMWAQAFGMVTRAVITMGGPLATLLGKVRQQFRGDAYETVDVRRKNAQNGIITVKRLKRPAPVPAAEQPHSEGSDDGYERLGWTDDPTKHIGFEQIQSIANGFATQLEIIKAGKVVGGASIADIYMQIQDGEDLHTSIALHKYLEQECGPMSPEDPDDERAAKVLRTLTLYQDRLESGISFMLQVYDCDLFEELKQRYTTPPRRLALGTTVFRQSSMLVGEFLCFLLTLKDVCNIDGATLEAICKMIVDANAIHKQLMPRSFVEEQPNPTEGMPGFFPEDSPMEDVPADELTIQPLYDFKFPEPEPAQSDEPQVEPGDYKLVPKPKGILKPSKEWEDPASPKYVTTPEKKRKLAFKSPVSKFIVPAHVPAKVMTPAEAERIFRAKQRADVLRDEHSIRAFEASRTVARHKNLLVDFEDKWNLEALERDEREMGLSYHARKYDGFLTDLQNDVEKRAKEEEERRWEPTFRPAREQRIVRIPLPPLPSTPERRRRRALLLEGDTRTSFISPGSNPLMRQKTEEEPPKVVEKRPEPRTLEEFFAQDEENDLEISVRKFEQLQIDRQIREELELGLRRDIEDRRRRREEEELREQERRLREEIRRKEEERRREEEARREKEAEEFAALTGLRRPTRRLITSLTGEWDLRVNNAARANPAVELAKTLEGQPLTRRDFEEKLLPPTAWLNDNVIIGSILHIADYINTTKGATNQEPKCAAFTSYFWPRLLSHGPSNCGRLLRRAGVRKANFFDIDTIIIPICDQSHWTLAVIRPERRTVAHIDSMRAGGGHASVKTKLLELVRFILEDQFVESEWRAVDYEAPRQTNGWDCGVFTITNALCMALSLDPKQSYTERELTMQRRRLAAILLNKGFKGEFSLDGI